MTQEEAKLWIRHAGRALGEDERYWFGSLYDMSRDMEYALKKRGPEGLAQICRTFAGPQSGPKLRALCLFGRALARSVAVPEAISVPEYGRA